MFSSEQLNTRQLNWPPEEEKLDHTASFSWAGLWVGSLSFLGGSFYFAGCTNYFLGRS